MITIRTAQWPQDAAVLSALDTTVVTELIYRPVIEDMSFQMIVETVEPPLEWRYPFQPSDPQERANWDFTVVAESDGKPAGFAAAQHVEWNSRVVLWHVYIDPSFRRQGVGTALIEAVDAYARSVDAWCVWVETQNVNFPAIQFYRHAGFRFCGFDETLYDPVRLKREEVALFFVRPISGRS